MFSVALSSLFLLAAAPAEAVKIPEGAVLEKVIAERDAALFGTMFDRCEPQTLADLVTPDMEFYHDKGGRMASRAVFVEDYRRSCQAKLAPDAWRSRRELVPGSMKVYPIPGFGAVEEGTHLFYERKGAGAESLVGRARFSLLWKLDPDGQWRMSRAFSIDHAAVSKGGAGR
ncbi:nuclear transport factor 2 family protein [Caulobacter mirabilis]|uniref:DUF4440 domain-containing protein n=1 Tax=Caulobacter mirabilis TaxID=69666 RepID=A0A2D2AX97_9CAUL|nr:nuclear transport factor 2 family protein [Caulobacter mirabilis]ATQ42613.1 DUF4440 domain-containing protein [Caulobacter mirabilis]